LRKNPTPSTTQLEGISTRNESQMAHVARITDERCRSCPLQMFRHPPAAILDERRPGDRVGCGVHAPTLCTFRRRLRIEIRARKSIAREGPRLKPLESSARAASFDRGCTIQAVLCPCRPEGRRGSSADSHSNDFTFSPALAIN